MIHPPAPFEPWTGGGELTLFEYISVAASLICSFIAVRLLGAVGPILRRDARYWVHIAWTVFTLAMLSVQWWLFWAYREADWNYGRFVLALTPLGLVYVLSSFLVPAEPGRIECWRTHFYEVRFRVCAMALATVVTMVLCTVVLLDHPLVHPRRILPVSLIALFATGMASDRPRVHEAIIVAFAGAFTITALVFSVPGSFGVAP